MSVPTPTHHQLDDHDQLDGHDQLDDHDRHYQRDDYYQQDGRGGGGGCAVPVLASACLPVIYFFCFVSTSFNKCMKLTMGTI